MFLPTKWRCLSVIFLGLFITVSLPISADETKDEVVEEAPKGLEEFVAEFEKSTGLFILYRDPENGSVYFEVTAEQLDKEYIYFTYSENGLAEAGLFRGNYREEAVFRLHKYYDKIEFIAENTHFYFDPKSALSRASEANISNALLASVTIDAVSEDGQRYLINMDTVLLQEALHQVNFLADPDTPPHEQFSLGSLSQEKTRYDDLKVYPENVDIRVIYAYDNDSPYVTGGDEVTDPRSMMITLQHTFMEMPQNSYEPRFDDARIGYFRNQVTDLTSHSITPYRDLINRWHLEKKNPFLAMSEPVEPIVWWLENTTPDAYREAITQGVLAWNEAFEKAGFKNAIVVKNQPLDATWNAGDVRYNVLRWTSSPNPPFGGYGPSFSNPRTGQILSADIMLEDIYVSNRVRSDSIFQPKEPLITPLNLRGLSAKHCLASFNISRGNALGRVSAAVLGNEIAASRMVQESLYELTLHEVGHTLGLNHNMRGSQLVDNDKINDASQTKGIISSSVMDYNAVNLAPPGQEQGDFYTTHPGPYDVWAIQFGYDPDIEGDRRISHLARSSESSLAFGNDADDMRAVGRAIDPKINIGDMSSDAIGYAADRFALLNESLITLRAKMIRPDQSWAELRNAYQVIAREHQTQARVVSRYIGGVYIDRTLPSNNTDEPVPYSPVPKARQKEAMEVLHNSVFGVDAFQVSADLISHLGMQRRGFDHWGETEDPKIHARALQTQKDVLNHLLHPVVMARITDTALYGNTYLLESALSDLTQSVFADDLKGDTNSFRQNLQVEYVNRLLSIVSEDEGNPYDYRARSAGLVEVERIEKWMKRYSRSGSPATKASRNYVYHLIKQGLERR
ncbi:MAG: DUF5117 domain-containing protein [Porticoccaceae bacterium]|nr:DUF5117 domain-containing protein [Porticoccaceae bacterium]